MAVFSSAPDYVREVKPLLEHKCYSCHGGLKQKAGLRLDTAAHIRAGGRHGAAIVPDDPANSLLLQRVRSADESQRMPLEANALTAEEIGVLERWIAAGATAPLGEKEQTDPRNYWSYQIVQRPSVPPFGQGNPIDAILGRHHDRLGLKIAPPAEKEVLLRRVYLDLIGLPPTPEELRAFGRDDSPRAYERLVDRLLEDPRHGERWGRHWMDVWRYSDWYGRRTLKERRYSVRHIWRWRDWIVKSLNADKGYDRMVVEMLAGDEVAPTDPGALAATGFIGRNWYVFDRNVWMFDVVERTSQGLLGLTMRCARCHDHKYDPISHEDYYRFRAFFEPHGVRTDPVDAKQETEKDPKAGPVLKQGLSRVFDEKLDAKTYLFRRGDDRNPDKTRELTPAVPASLTLRPVDVRPIELPPEAYYPGLHPQMIERGRSLAVEKVANAQALTRKAEADREALRKRIARFKSGAEAIPQREAEFLADTFDTEQKDVWKKLNGNWAWKDGLLSETQVTSFATLETKNNHPPNFRVKVRYRALQPGHYRSIGFSFDQLDRGNSQDVYTSTGDARQSVQAFHRVKGKHNYPRAGIVRTELKVGDVTTVEAEARGQQLKIWLNGEEKLVYQMPIARQPGKFALWVHSGAAEFLDLEIIGLEKSLPDLELELAGFEKVIAAKRHGELIAEAERAAFERRLAAERARYAGSAETNSLYRAAVKAEAKVSILVAERDLLVGADSKATLEQKLKQAKDSFANPGVKYESFGKVNPSRSTGRRAALANWVASRDNPRTARVAVNHMWLRHFGAALVPSVANFGLNGKQPTHPELLDWLAAELMDNEWSMKHVHRLMVTSDAYRRSAKPVAGVKNNLHYVRMNSRRMEAEVIRDSILHLSDGLDQSMGGEDIDDAKGDQIPRRTIYFRVTPDRQMQLTSAFDAANPNACYRREHSVVPHQSLALFNGALAQDRARTLARSIARQCADDASFVNTAWLKVLNREASANQVRLMKSFLQEQRRLLTKANGLEAFTKGGSGKVAPSSDPNLRARENLVHALFNHNEFVTIR
ncbi:MAG: DUF1549 domain-containing protein [Limisphaerales bacterium]